LEAVLEAPRTSTSVANAAVTNEATAVLNSKIKGASPKNASAVVDVVNTTDEANSAFDGAADGAGVGAGVDTVGLAVGFSVGSRVGGASSVKTAAAVAVNDKATSIVPSVAVAADEASA